MTNNKKILIVEDEDALRKAMNETLTNEGFSVIEARDGQEGIQIALDTTPDLVILDIAMPKLSGMTVLARLRAANNWGSTVPVILFTNFEASDDMTKQLTRDNPSYYLMKVSSSLSDIVEKVKGVLGV